MSSPLRPPAASAHSSSDLEEQEISAFYERHRAELQSYCYRMLGSLHDAEDSVQDTLLRAWRARATFDGGASMRAWLYRIATRVCLDALRHRQRRILPADYAPAATAATSAPSIIDEPIWLEPYPDALLRDLDDPHARYSLKESISLAFVAAVQYLPPRQRAILLLRDVFDWTAAEVAEFIDGSVASVNSALQRARATLRVRLPAGESTFSPQTADDIHGRAVVDAYVQAWEDGDLTALLALLKEDVAVSMPPDSLWFRGRQSFSDYLRATLLAERAPQRFRLVRTAANGQPSFAFYQSEGQLYRALGIVVLTVAEDRIAAITGFFEPSLLPRFAVEQTIAV